MIPVTHVITGLDLGGAEMALCRLIEATDRDAFDLRVVSLTTPGQLADRIASVGVEVHILGMTSLGIMPALVRLRRHLRRWRPSVVQTWMYHADVIGGLAARAAGVPAVAWSLRSSDFAPGAWRRSTVLLARVEARLASRVPAAIVCGSDAARRFHIGLGFPPELMSVIPNGFDIPTVASGTRDDVRDELGAPRDSLLVGRVGRFHPHKDHRTFVAAAELLARRHHGVHFVLCGDGVDGHNAVLTSWIRDAGLTGRTHLLGRRSDTDRIHAALDVACSSSLGEGFPNVVGEAMAAGVPVVTTDVGDSALLVGDTGRVVRPRDPEALAAAIAQMLDLAQADRRALGRAARQRIEQCYGLQRMADHHADLYRRLASAEGQHRPSMN